MYLPPTTIKSPILKSAVNVVPVPTTSKLLAVRDTVPTMLKSSKLEWISLVGVDPQIWSPVDK